MSLPEGGLPQDTNTSIARAATLTSIGNVSSRLIGLLRETVKSFFFGTRQAASAYELASNLPTSFYDLLVGGMLSSALVPTFSRLASDDDSEAGRREFGRLLGALIGLGMAGLFVIVAVLFVFAYPIAQFRGGPLQDAGQLATLLRITIPSILFMNVSGLVTAALQARRRFGYTAFTATVSNLCMIACVVAFEPALGVTSLAVGLLAGSIAQLMIQLPGLRGVPVAISLNWRLPGITQIGRLFLPVVGGLLLSLLAAEASYIVSALISVDAPSTMRYAAQIIQFPLGMIVSAVSVAILPALSSSSGERFKQTLASGLRLMLVLIAPVAAGLYVLSTPVVALLFQHGAFDAASTAATAAALRSAVPNLVFSAIDVPIIFAFYALRDTRTPTLIGLVSTLLYIVILVALVGLSRAGLWPFTLEQLILANSIKTGIDAAIMLPMLWRKIGGLHGHGISALGLRVVAASILSGGAVAFVSDWVMAQVGLTGRTAQLTVIVSATAAGALVYLACAAVLKIRELEFLQRFLARGGKVKT